MPSKKAKSKAKAKKVAPENPKKEKSEAKNLDEFLSTWSDDDESGSGEESQEEQETPEATANGDDGTDGESNDDSEEETSAKDQRKYLSNLSKSDPEFYEFLKTEDKELLNFDDDDSDSDEDDEEKPEGSHELPETLEVASDESDFEDEEEEEGTGKQNSVTNAMIDKWTDQLKSSPSIGVISDVVQAFKAAVGTIGGQDEQETEKKVKKGTKKASSGPVLSKYHVEGSTKFNSITRMCLGHMSGAISKVLKVDASKTNPQKSKQWQKMNKHIKSYSSDLNKLAGCITSASVLTALLKHVHTVVPYVACLPKQSKMLIKTLINVWSAHKEESARVLAYMSLLKLTRCTIRFSDEEGGISSLLEPVLKQMYMSYIRNVKFTSPTTWPSINFMRRSLAEIFNLDQSVCYRFTFIYIRQLTIQLRNAMLQGKTGSSHPKKSKDVLQTVYNWQFVHSLHLWTQLLCDTYPSQVLEPLIYPLIQVITGTIKLMYTTTFYPMRFLLCILLSQISEATGKYVPVLPYYTDILANYNFGKKTTKISMKPMDFSCALRMSKSQMAENGFKDAVLEAVYAGILQQLQCHSHRISFPEIVVPISSQMRKFVKTCSVSNYTKKIRQILDKTNETTKVVLDRRRKIRDFTVGDLDKIHAWEVALKTEGTPLSKFYSSWKSVKDTKDMKTVTNQEKLDDYDFVPKMTKKEKKVKEKEEFKGILGGDSDDDSEDDEERFKLKEDRGRKRSNEESEDEDSEEEEEETPPKKKKKTASKRMLITAESDDEDVDDEVKDFDMEDFGESDDGEEEEGSEDSAENDQDEDQSGDDDDSESDEDSN